MSASKASVTVPRAWFEQCYLPGVCVRTGVDTTETRERTAEYHNPIMWVGIFFGLIAVFLIDLILGKKAYGRIPFADEAGVEQRRNIGIVITAVGGCMMLALFSGIDDLMLLGLLGVFVLFGGIVYLIRVPNLGIETKLSPDLNIVTLKNVHPRFAAATTDLLHRARAMEQPAPAPFDARALHRPQTHA